MGAGFSISVSPLTTKGDVFGRDVNQDVRVPVGADGRVLQADSGQASGLAWALKQQFNIVWNDAGSDLEGAEVNVTNTASGANSKLFHARLGGVTKFFVDKSGQAHGGSYFFSPTDNSIYIGWNGSRLITEKSFSTGGHFISETGGYRLANGGGSAADAGVERHAAGVAKFTDGNGALRDFRARRGAITEFAALEPVAEPASPATGLVLFCVDTAGKMELKVKAPSGDVGTLYTEP